MCVCLRVCPCVRAYHTTYHARLTFVRSFMNVTFETLDTFHMVGDVASRTYTLASKSSLTRICSLHMTDTCHMGGGYCIRRRIHVSYQNVFSSHDGSRIPHISTIACTSTYTCVCARAHTRVCFTGTILSANRRRSL